MSQAGQFRHPPAVYRRRRLAVFGGLIAVIVVVALIIWRPTLGGTPVAEPEPADQLVEEVEIIPECTSAQIELIPETDQSRYAPGVTPQLAMTIRNIGQVECEIAVGPDVQEFIIDSGPRDNPDPIWSSVDCQEAATPNTITLQPGEERMTAAIAWDRTRSSPDTCNDTRPQVIAEGASYHLSVKLGDFESAETKQFLLD